MQTGSRVSAGTGGGAFRESGTGRAGSASRKPETQAVGQVKREREMRDTGGEAGGRASD